MENDIFRENLNKLLFNASKGDRASFEKIVGLFNSKLIAIARCYTDSEAEDAVQEVWVKVWDKAFLLENVENIDNWLFMVVKRHCLDKIRKSKSSEKKAVTLSYEEHHELIESLIINDESPEKVFQKNSLKIILLKFIESLGEIYSIPIKLFYFEDYSLKEISQLTNVSVSTLKWRMHIARQLIKKELIKGEYFYDKKTGNKYVKSNQKNGN